MWQQFGPRQREDFSMARCSLVSPEQLETLERCCIIVLQTCHISSCASHNESAPLRPLPVLFVLVLTGSALGMGWTGPAVPSSCCWDSSVALTSSTSATTCSKSKGRMARTRSSKMWWVHVICCVSSILPCCWRLAIISPKNTSLLFFRSRWRRWQIASGSTRSSTMRYLPSWTSTWRQWRRTVPLWSMFAVSSLLYTNPWLPLAEKTFENCTHTHKWRHIPLSCDANFCLLLLFVRCKVPQ